MLDEFPEIFKNKNKKEHKTQELQNALYQEVYLKDYRDGRDAYKSLKEYFAFYNKERPHEALNKMTPKSSYLIDKERLN